MNRRLVTSLTIAGLVLAVFGTVILQFGRFSIGEALFCGAFATGAGALAAIGILLDFDRNRTLAIVAVALSGVAAASFFVAGLAATASAYGQIGQTKVGEFPTGWMPWLVIGTIAYLAAATAYGFVGTAQGVVVTNRVALLLLLLLAVVPVASILGLAGTVVTTTRRKPIA